MIPRKTRKHAHGRPVSIPIHPVLERALGTLRPAPGAPAQGPNHPAQGGSPCVLPTLADWYAHARWRVGEGLKRIFAKANITTSVRIEGRCFKAPEATFHSLRHTFVSLAANAGVPLAVIQSIVGHGSSAMTRHYYHESESALQSAIAALPNVAASAEGGGRSAEIGERRAEGESVAERLKRLESLFAAKAITRREYKSTRLRILGEL